MCTVSFIASNNNFIITSNRDDHTARSASFNANAQEINGIKVIYPKDPKAGGTWFAINENGVCTVLLNGAFEKHKHLSNYRKSRGLVVLDVIGSENPRQYVADCKLEGIEPFTLVLFQAKKLQEIRWDGSKKHIKDLDVNEKHIWSSATLYSKEIREERKRLFTEFIDNTEQISKADVINFHSNNHQDFENGFIIKRSDVLKTLSITQAVFTGSEISLMHKDLLSDTENIASLKNKTQSNYLQ